MPIKLELKYDCWFASHTVATIVVWFGLCQMTTHTQIAISWSMFESTWELLLDMLWGHSFQRPSLARVRPLDFEIKTSHASQSTWEKLWVYLWEHVFLVIVMSTFGPLSLDGETLLLLEVRRTTLHYDVEWWVSPRIHCIITSWVSQVLHVQTNFYIFMGL